MIRIGGRISNTDARIDHANKAIHDTNTEIAETDRWVEELETELGRLISNHDDLAKDVTFEKNKLVSISERLKRCQDEIQDLKSRPAPLIPDIAPLRAELRLLRVVLDETVISHNEELTAIWRSLGDINRHVDNIKPTDLSPVYRLVKISLFLNVLTLVYLLIEAFHV